LSAANINSDQNRKIIKKTHISPFSKGQIKSSPKNLNKIYNKKMSITNEQEPLLS